MPFDTRTDLDYFNCTIKCLHESVIIFFFKFQICFQFCLILYEWKIPYNSTYHKDSLKRDCSLVLPSACCICVVVYILRVEKWPRGRVSEKKAQRHSIDFGEVPGCKPRLLFGLVTFYSNVTCRYWLIFVYQFITKEKQYILQILSIFTTSWW